MIYVLGHKNPDTDSYCAAVACAAFLTGTGEHATPVALGEPNSETAFVFEQLGYRLPKVVDSLPAGSDVVLVDHNEAGQSIDGRESLNILAVYDHHKIADFVTSGPLTMRFDPVGCTCTILHEEFQRHSWTPSKEIATLMCAAIVSDSLLYRSPTTTVRDREALEALSKIAEINDLESWAMAMFDAKSDLTGMSAHDIITMDYKQFDFSGTAMGIGVIETTNPAFALDRKAELLEAIEELKEQEGLEYVLVCVVDILNEQNTALLASMDEAALVKGAFGVHADDHQVDLGARVSRKKQIAPDIADWFEARE